MANVSGLLAALEVPEYPINSGKKPFSSIKVLIESYGAVARDGLLADSVSQATADGVSIEFKGFGDPGRTYPYTRINSVFLPSPEYRAMTAQEGMTVFLFETRNAMRARKYCELRKQAALNQITKEIFIKKMAEYETRGGLEVGKTWQQIVDRYGSAHTPPAGWPKYYHGLYLKAPQWETNAAQLDAVISSVLSSVYSSGDDAGQSRSWAYENRHYNPIISNRSAYSSQTCTGNNLTYTATGLSQPVGVA
jgi:hypothetical protein